MEALQQRIIREGRILPGNIVKVDGFLNHQVDARFLGEIADEISRLFDLTGVTKVLTAEASGIPLATVCAYKFGVPMVFAKKAKSDNIEGGLYKSEIFSYTYKKKVTLICSQQWISSEDKVLIVDIFTMSMRPRMAAPFAMKSSTMRTLSLLPIHCWEQIRVTFFL